MDRSSDLTLRIAHLADAPALAAMSRDLIETGLAWRYRTAQLAVMVRDPDTVVLVACCAASAPLGFAAMHFAQDTAHLTLLLLCVRPAHRRQRMATQLVEWLVESAWVAGILSIQLELRADNAAALALYRRLGFFEQHRVADYYGPQIAARRMVRVLRPSPQNTAS